MTELKQKKAEAIRALLGSSETAKEKAKSAGTTAMNAAITRNEIALENGTIENKHLGAVCAMSPTTLGEIVELSILACTSPRNQFVGSDGDSPVKIHSTFSEAKRAKHSYIDEFSIDGEPVTSWKRNEDGTYTDNF